MKVHVEIGHLTKYVAFRVNRHQTIILEMNTGHLAYVQTRLRTNSPTTCQLAYVGEFTEVLLPFITLCYHFVNNVQNTSVFV